MAPAFARRADAMRSGRAWVWTQDGTGVACFTLAGHVIERGDLPQKSGRGSPDRIPAALIAKLALDESLHGRGLGGTLLADASSRIVRRPTLLLRDSLSSTLSTHARQVSTRYGFERMPGTNPLVRKISELADDVRGSAEIPDS